jgi:hypothetical protein
MDQLEAKEAGLASPKPSRPRSATVAPDAAKRGKSGDQAAFELQDKLIKQLREQLGKMVAKREEDTLQWKQDAEKLARYESNCFVLQDELDSLKLKHEYYVQNKTKENDALQAKLGELQEEKSRLLDLSQQGFIASSASSTAAAETNEESLIQMTMALNKMARPKDEVSADYVAKLELQIATLEVQLDQSRESELREQDDDDRQGQLLLNEEQSHEHTRQRLSEEMQTRMIAEQKLMDAERQLVLMTVDHDALKEELRALKQNNEQLAKDHANDSKDAEHAQEILLQKQKEMEKLQQRLQQMGPSSGSGGGAEELKELKRDLAEESRNNERLTAENKDLKRKVEQLNEMLQRELRKADRMEAAAGRRASVAAADLAGGGGSASADVVPAAAGAGLTATPGVCPTCGSTGGGASAGPYEYDYRYQTTLDAAVKYSVAAEENDSMVEAAAQSVVVVAAAAEAEAARHFVAEQQKHAAQRHDITSQIDEVERQLLAGEAAVLQGSAPAVETAALRHEMERLRAAAAAKEAEQAEAMRRVTAELEAAAAAAAAVASARPPSSMRPRTPEKMPEADFDKCTPPAAAPA